MKTDTSGKLGLEQSEQAFARSQELIPGGVLGIRRPYNFVPGEYPVFFDRGKGGRVTDVDGNEYIDYLCGYGPIILGYREEEVDEAVVKQIRDRGFCFSLTQRHQNRLAETMHRLIPCGEMSLFVKTGSDAATCSIRLARSYTGRNKVLRCGYHGWHDWCVEVKGGVPEGAYRDVTEFPYNDIDALESLLESQGDETAAIIITPYGHPLARPMEAPRTGYLENVKRLAEKWGCVLIFDEIRTGFRLSIGGAQELYGVTPHLAIFGKAMANGYSIAAVTGRKDIMSRAEKDVFISSTFFPNSIGYVAALKTIEIMEREDVLEAIRSKGERYMRDVSPLLEAASFPVRLSGEAPMSFITFDRDEDGLYKLRRQRFYTALIRQGVFQQPYHHGYICWRHTGEDLAFTIAAIGRALEFAGEDTPD